MRGFPHGGRFAASAVLGVALLTGCGSPRPGAPAAPVVAGGAALPFIENDFARASARARESGLPLFVEVWAPW